MLRRFIPAAVAAISLAGLAFTSPASAATLGWSSHYGCASGDFCVYSTYVISTETKVGIGRGEDWGDGKLSSWGKSPYKGVYSFFNNGKPGEGGEDHVVVTYAYSPDSAPHKMCVHYAEDNNLAIGHELTDSGVAATVLKIDWVPASTCDG
ncbi:hypothetical protein DMB42_17590 [Nonomuraea sp. WAC 01424]|uniref:hypothetical protein n=1 Tax=Nonomuraea sp. WAC 01424 TaxID=2203200 RepID=UPI000F76E0B3|nr:hypothetical protein [Nonomuraea sp. WAC 01424]RSN09146.1 hypothetical protein DMB42_17590 [Nonomuraea sp. WAC 01424]